MSTLQRRLHAFRDDLADARLKGRVDAARFVEGVPAQCSVPLASVFKAPADDATQVTQILLGESCHVFDRAGGFAFVQLDTDGYVGYVREQALQDNVVETTHRVSVLLTHLYPSANIKTQPAIAVPLNARVASRSHEGDFHHLANGKHIYASHLSTGAESDFVSVAERFLHTPYLWGGKTVLGIDCSGLVQVSLAACGVTVLRDSDMQEESLGVDVTGQDLRRGDLVFWKGHVGIMQDATTLLHANGYHMLVVSEPLQLAIDRIALKGSAVTAVKRL